MKSAELTRGNRRDAKTAGSSRRPEPADRSRALEWTVIALLTALLLILRLHQIDGPLDEPHAWRQADTANYARDFYRHGMNLLQPMVCWQGAAPLLALEFPIYEWLVAAAYGLIGEHLAIARLLSLASWLTATVYLFALVRRVGGEQWARWAAFVYATVPLGVYFSRAVHIDFATTAAAHAMAYHFLRAIDSSERRSGWHAALGALFGSFAFAIDRKSVV